MAKCCGCCPCRCKKKRNKNDSRARNLSMMKNPSMIRNPSIMRNPIMAKTSKTRKPSVAKVPSITALAFNIPNTKDDSVINLENLPMSIDDIEAHYADIKNVYKYAIETMNNFLGKPCYPFNTQPKQLYPYIRHICDGLQAHEYTSLNEEVAGVQLTNVQVSLMIKDVKLIHPKMTDFSQIFCKVWITKEDEKITTVKEGTSSLVWDETFTLDAINYESDIIHVEVWSCRPGGLLERLTLIPEHFKEDDPLAEENGLFFIGDAVEYVKFLPCVNRNILWTLKKGPRRAFTTGQLNIYLQLGTKKTSEFMLHLYCQMTFIRLSYEKKVLKEDESHSFWKNWLEILPNEALTLIQQHAIQHGLSPAEQCLCSWLVTLSLKMRHEDRISFNLLQDLMEYLFENVAEIEVGQAKDLFIKSISDFSAFSLDLLKRLHKNFDLQDVEMADELFYLLRAMVTAELRLRTHYMDSFEVLEEESSEWYLEVITEQKDDLQNDESVVALCDVLKNIMKIYLRNQIILDNIFMRAWNIRYTAITYKKLDHVVYSTIQSMIKHIIILMDDPKRKTKSTESLVMLQLYYGVRNLANYVQNIVSSQSILRMSEYSVWFGEEIVLEWFLLCDFYTSQFIQRAVLEDKMEKLNPKVYHGTSVPDVVSIIDEMVVDVWMKLKWEDQFYTHGALIEATKSCIVYYSKSTLDRMEVEKFFCPRDKFEMSTKLCVAMSNMHAITEYVLRITKKIEKEFEVAESAIGFKISEPLLSIQSEMQVMTSTVFLLIFKKISEAIKRLIREAVVDAGDITSGQFHLYLFMDATLGVMYSHLKYDAFCIALRQLWVVVIYRLSRVTYKMSCFMTKKRKMKIYMAYMQALNQMKIIFLCDGHGLTEYEMENKMYEELRKALEKRLALE